MNPTSRILFLDHLRAFVIVLVIILHGSMIYMAYAPPWWYVVDTQSSLFFTYLVLLIDVPIMLILFFIAGFFAMPSLVRRGSANFIKEKFIRVGAPWLVGALFLAPPTAYMSYYTRNAPVSLLQFWASDFWTIAFQQSVYWYLGVLFFFFLILGIAYHASQLFQAANRSVTLPTWKLFISFLALMSLGMFVMNQFFASDDWYNRFYILVFQPLRAPLYVGYFGLGIYAHLRGWFTTDGYKPDLPTWVMLWFLSGVMYLLFRIHMTSNPESAIGVQIAHAVLFNAFCLSSLMAGAALFQQKINKSTRIWSSLSTNAYGMYYVHPLVLYPLAYLFTSISLPLWIKAPIVILSGVFLAWALSSVFLTKAPVLRRAFA